MRADLALLPDRLLLQRLLLLRLHVLLLQLLMDLEQLHHLLLDVLNELLNLLRMLGVNRRIQRERHHLAQLARDAADAAAHTLLTPHAADGAASRLGHPAQQIADQSLRRNLALLGQLLYQLRQRVLALLGQLLYQLRQRVLLLWLLQLLELLLLGLLRVRGCHRIHAKWPDAAETAAALADLLAELLAGADRTAPWRAAHDALETLWC